MKNSPPCGTKIEPNYRKLLLTYRQKNNISDNNNNLNLNQGGLLTLFYY
jgi:hypothetical protein